MSAVLEAEHVRVSYGRSVAVDDISLRVEEGELVAIAGANGAGKSTFVNALAGWSRAAPKATGSVIFNGTDVSHLKAEKRARRGIALVPESHGAFADMTVYENLSMVTAHNFTGKTYAIEDIYELFPRLEERRDQQARTLSGGERQMLAIGRALRQAPSLLILDEPSVGLAPRLVMEVLRHVKALTAEGLAVLLVEQNVRAALEVADRLSLLEQGLITATGTADEMREDDRTISAYLGGLTSS